MQTKTSKNQSFFIDSLVIFALWSIVITQPLLNILGDAASFFVAHDANRFDILLFTFFVALGLPTLLILIEFLVGKTSYKARKVFHFLLVALLAMGFALILINKTRLANPLVVVGLSALIGAIIAILIYKAESARSITALASAGALLFPVIFLLFTPVSLFIFGKETAGFTATKTDAKTPVVLVVFDEFSPLGLLDANNQIDPVRFPHFAAFAENATWFPKAASVHIQSFKAVPAITTGKFPPDEDVLPSQTAHPNNLFTLLGESYNFNVTENFTALCPKPYCGSENETDGLKPSIFLSDITVIIKHLFYPKVWAEQYLPNLDAGWNNFDKKSATKNLHTINNTKNSPQTNAVEKTANELAEYKKKNIVKLDLIESFREFIHGVEPGTSTLDFIHIVLPHTPWQYLPDGRVYDDHPIGPTWKNQSDADEAYHRYLMQLGMTDSLIGELMSKLKKVDKYDDALVILTADHGVGFKSKIYKRGVQMNNAVLHIPLLIKLPNQQQSQINDKFVLNIDILPTIADILDIRIPWETNGKSIFDDNFPSRDGVELFLKVKKYKYTKEKIVDYNAVPNRIEKFGERTPLNDLSINGPYSDLIGKNLSDLEENIQNWKKPPFIGASLNKFKDINLSSDYIPVMFWGDITLPNHSKNSHSIAIALNGKISAVTPTIGNDLIREFSSFLLPADFVNGDNHVEAFLIGNDMDGNIALIQIAMKENQYRLLYTSTDNIFLTDETGKEYPLKKFKSPGMFRMNLKSKSVNFSGWAADIDQGQPAQIILVFRDDILIGSSRTGLPSPRLVNAHKNEELALSRFDFNVPTAKFNDIKELRIYAIYPSGHAAELTQSE